MTVSAAPEPVLPPRRRPWGVVVLVAVVVAVVAYLAFSSIGSALVYYRTPTELAAMDDAVGQAMRLGGIVKEGSVQGPATDLTFVLTDGDAEIEVHSTVAPTRSFREGSGAVVEGRADPGRRVRGDPGDREARRELPGAGTRRTPVGPRLRSRGRVSRP